MKYRKKPVEVDVHRYDGDHKEAIAWANNVSDGDGTGLIYDSDYGLAISTKEGIMHVSVGDYIICGVDGEFYPCKPNIFRKTYERMDVIHEY